MFRRLSTMAGTLLIAFQAHAANLTPLVDGDWLEAHLEEDNLVILDVRSPIDNGGDRASFEAAHIPGSIYSSYTEDGWRESRNEVAGLMPAVADLENLISELGIGNDHTLVIVSAGTGETDFGSAARVYWTFKVLGHDDVAILNGGFAGWKQQNFEVASGPSPDPVSANFQASLREELIATTEEVEAASSSQAQLVDARPSDYFTGDNKSPAAQVAGTIPGSTNLPHHTLMQDQDGAFFLDVDGLQARVNEAELDRNAQTIAFCNTGHWAATDWFVLNEMAGFENVSMYDGSMAAWTLGDTRPVQVAKRGLGKVLDFFN